MAKSNRASNLDDIRRRLRSVGMRSTSARIAVLRRLDAARKPLSHAEMADQLAGDGFDRVTVYRNLLELVDSGLASRVDLGDHVWRFEVFREEGGHRNDHPHFVCLDCGGVACLSGVTVTVRPARGAKAPAFGEVTEVVLKGHCANCS